MNGLPNRIVVETILAEIDALIGLSASFPQTRSRIEIEDTRDEERYEELWRDVNQRLVSLRESGFPFANPNLHQSLRSMWAWCISFDEPWGDLRRRPNQLYAATIDRLVALREILSHADAPIEVQREFRESARRTNELFIVMAFREETRPFREQIVEPAARAVG